MSPRLLLIVSALAIAIIWHLPYGKQILYPLSLLATFAHEMGHGLTALAVGESFEQMRLYADGSGLALWRGTPGRFATALIAAGGLVGPTLAGVALLVIVRTARFARLTLAGVALFITLAVVLWVRNAFGVVFLLGCAVILGTAAQLLSANAARFVLALIAEMLCISAFNDIDYLFSDYAEVNGARHASDTMVIAQALWLPYWLWGAVIAFFSLAVAALGIAAMGERSRQPR